MTRLPPFVHTAPQQPLQPSRAVVNGDRLTWTTQGRIPPKAVANLPEKEAEALIARGRAKPSRAP